jgi:hypothetical protein
MNRSGSEPSGGIRGGLGSYLRAGYLWDPSTTLENASADFAVSRFARRWAICRWPRPSRRGPPVGERLQPRHRLRAAPQARRQLGDALRSRRAARLRRGERAQYTFMIPYDLPASTPAGRQRKAIAASTISSAS